jgi:alpha-1,6-mannosyltransferase
MKSRYTILYLLIAISIAAYAALAYYTPRENFWQLITTFAALFGVYFWLLKTAQKEIKLLVTAAIAFRVIMLFGFPTLSDDIYRFYWDGLLLSNGENPFLHLPAYYLQPGNELPGLSSELYNKLNSPEYYTIYPPISQFVFTVAAWLSPKSIYGAMLVMKLFIFLAEIGTILTISKILKHLKMPSKQILIYALNPLAIVELTGNMHFEAIMIFFLALSMWLLMQNKIIVSAAVFALSVCTKLIPLMFLPLLIAKIGWKKSVVYFSIVGVATAAMFLPFVSSTLISNFTNSLDLYFQKFEFNASIYYLVRKVGFWITGYNIIAKAGPLLSIITLLGITAISTFQKKENIKSLPLSMLLAISLYLLFATTVHPWYLLTLVFLSTFTQFKFPIVWSAAVLLSYFAYSNATYSESMLLISIEYTVVITFAIYEYLKLPNSIFASKA